MQLGIDIIDLTDPLLKERTSRSLELILNEEDQTIDHSNLFWLLWSAKEAVFKCRREPLNFAPKSIPIELAIKNEEITFISETLEGKIIQKENYLLAICGDQLKEINFEVFEEETNHWSEQIRKLAVTFFESRGFQYQIGSDDLNLPTILPLNQPISVSHHGKMGAVAYPVSLLESK